MKTQCRRHQIDQGRLVTDFTIAKELRAADVTTPAMSFDAPPIINTLKNVFAIFADL
jgi:hypothetical protein